MTNEEWELLNEEHFVHQQMIQWFKGKLNAQPGKIYITRKRIVIEYSGNPIAGILPKLVFKSQRPRVVFNALHKDIVSIVNEKFGMNTVAVITDRDGNQVRVGGMDAVEIQKYCS
jgi:hypothetical protein